MENSGGDIIAKVLKSHGVQHLFTLCGGHISPILVGSKKMGIKVVDVRSEVHAVFAADAVSRMTGVPGVAVVTAGPGVTNTVTALKNAQMAQSPLVLLGGAAATIIKGRGSLQDIDQISLVNSCVKAAFTIKRSCDIVPVVEKAFHTAKTGVPGPVFVECPIDLLYNEKLVREWYGSASGRPGQKGLRGSIFQFYLNHHVNRMFACDLDTVEPEPYEVKTPPLKESRLEKAVQLIQRAEKPVLIIGSQSMLHPGEAGRLASAVLELGIPVYLTGMARGLLGGSASIQVRHNRREALKNADLVMIAGMPCDFRLGYGRAINAKAVFISINRSKSDLTLNRKPDLGIQADPCLFLRSLSAKNGSKKNRWERWIQKLQDKDRKREEEIVLFSREQTDFVNPILFLKRLDDFLEEDSLIVADGGDFVATSAYVLRPRTPLSWLDPGVFGTLGVGAGFAVGAKLSKPDSEVWLIYGDGAAGYSLQEFDTCVRHHIPVIAVVGNDGGWAQVARDQVDVLKDDVATNLNRTEYNRIVEGFGGKGFQIEREDQILPALEEARSVAKGGTPVLINLLIGKTDFRKGSISM